MPELYPVLLDLKGKHCLVVGGGLVAARKTASMYAAGAKIIVVSPVLCSDLRESVARGEIFHLQREFLESDLSGAFLAVAATDDSAVNKRIGQVAETLGVLTNIVDSPEASGFIVPSVIRRGDLIIAIATSGISPALSRKLRLRLEKEIGMEYGELVKIVGEVRADFKSRHVRISEIAWQKALDIDEMIAMIQENRRDRAKSILVQKLMSKAEDA